MLKNKRLLIAAAAALLFGTVAAISVSKYLATAQAYTKDLTTVVVARVEIPVGTKLIAEQLEVLKYPRGVLPQGTFQRVDESLIGRVVVSRIDVREPITESRLAPVGSAGGLSSVIPDGYRAMTVKVDDVVGVSGFIMPGALVDIVVTIEPPENSQHKERVSKIVLQNIKVLANGQNIDKPKNDREAERVKAVTLQVTPEQAEKLALASTEGKLQLVMRNAVDQGDEQTPGANKSSLLSGERALPVPEPGFGQTPPLAKPAAAPRRARAASAPAPREVTAAPRAAAPPPPAPPRPSVEVIEGAKKRSVDFP